MSMHSSCGYVICQLEFSQLNEYDIVEDYKRLLDVTENKTLRRGSIKTNVVHHPVSHFLDHRSLLISCSPTEPYPSLHQVFGMTYTSRTPHHFFTSTTVIAIKRHHLHPSPLSVTPGPSTQN